MTAAHAALAPAQRLPELGPPASPFLPEQHRSAPLSLPGTWRGFVQNLSACVPFLLISPIDWIEDIIYIDDINNGSKS